MKDKIYVVSDTHGLLRPKVLEYLKDADMIIHAGDIGSQEVLKNLQEIAPLVVVRGNVDTGGWACCLPKTEVVQVKEKSIYLLHNIEELNIDLKAAGIDAVIYGHSHRPSVSKKNGILFLNPGSAGPRRFSLPVTMAGLLFTETGLKGEIICLD